MARKKKQKQYNPEDQRCFHCQGLHFGDPPGFCPYLCKVCNKDIRPGEADGCKCHAAPISTS